MLDKIITELCRDRNLERPGLIREYFPMVIRYSSLNISVRVRSTAEIVPGLSFRVIAVRSIGGLVEEASDTAPVLPLQYVINRHVQRALDACQGNRTAAARLLSTSFETIRRWVDSNNYEYKLADHMRMLG